MFWKVENRMTEIQVKYLDKILIRNKIIEVGSKLYQIKENVAK